MNKLLAALTALCLAAAAHAFDSRELTVQLQAPKTVQGRFTQQKYLRTLTKPVTTSGRFALRPGHGLFWHLQKPFELRLRVRRDGISRQDASGAWKSNGSQSTQAAQVKLFMAVLGGDTAELQRHFTLKLSGSAGNWQLLLLPKTVVMKQVFENITISGDKLVRRIELKEKQGDRTVMQFEQLQTDQALDAAAKQALE
ncbi:outer membrane lipoprotein carrier protein LolA [Kingella sp. SNUBH-2017]|uniref:LolA family protein n=1 Tax=Kingella sp. SNUBH-2017 TaxID=2994077 RepID=UPI002363444D|nr:outer membrane lipoprotein carrier protein LolA [Kingella sp. SNUBH-2017]MDD2183130.1 outer membrane lipoprotein carrier protein LolA [Kingella sp. SNUBH-2017]